MQVSALELMSEGQQCWERVREKEGRGRQRGRKEIGQETRGGAGSWDPGRRILVPEDRVGEHQV